MANSKIYLGSTNIGSLFQGADDISIYLGEEKVYPLAFKLNTMINGQKALNIGCTSGNTTISSAETHPSTAYTLYTSAAIGECVDTIGDGAFSGYTSMTGITIPDTITSIGNYAFQTCLYLSDYSIPSGVTSIGSNAFNSCEHITSIVIPDSVTSIGNYAFYACNRVTSLSIGSGLTNIGDNVFYNCTGLTSVNIPDTITSIGTGAFQYCRGLNSINIGNGVTTIGYYAFNTCSSATSVSIGSGVTTIRSEAFAGCSALTSITINAITPPTLGSNVFYNTNDCPIYVPCESVDAYKAAWTDYASRITCVEPVFKWKATYQDSHIESAQCDSSSAITQNEINRTNLVSVEIGDCVTSIGNGTFSNCSSLTSIEIPNSVISIGEAAFEFCEILTRLNSDVDGVFNIPDSVTTIGMSAFYGCERLTSIEIPNSVTSIGQGAFMYCSSLTSCTIGSGVTSIGDGAFNYCSSLTSVVIPNSVTSIGNQAFEGCSSLTSIAIPNSVISIGERVFNSCSGLTSIDIPNSVASIGNFAFEGCSSLTSVTVLATTPPTLGMGAFNGSTCPILVPSASLTAYQTAWSEYRDRLQAISTGYTYSVTITGLENGDTTDIVWDGGSYVDYGVGNGIYTYSSENDFMGVDVLNYSQDYQVSGAIVLSPSNPSGTITFSKVGGLTHIPQGTDMSQYYNQTITRFNIGDSSLPSGYQQVNLAFQTGGSGNISSWTNFRFDNTSVSSLPCDVTGSDSLTQWTCFNSSWQSTTENPFTDLWIELA